MKTLKNIRESNVSAGIGVRGFGDVSGTPATTGDVENSHIQRVVLGATEYSQEVQNYIDNNTQGIYTFDDNNWWAKPGSVKSITPLQKTTTRTPLQKTTTSDRMSLKLSEDAPTNSAGSGAIAGLGVGQQGEPGVLLTARKKHKKRARETFYMLRRK